MSSSFNFRDFLCHFSILHYFTILLFLIFLYAQVRALKGKGAFSEEEVNWQKLIHRNIFVTKAQAANNRKNFACKRIFYFPPVFISHCYDIHTIHFKIDLESVFHIILVIL